MKSGVEFNAYYGIYIDLSKSKELVPSLVDGMSNTVSFFNDIPAEKHEYRYDEGKWTPKEVLLHIIDAERVFMYRAMQFARANNVVLEGFDQNEFAENSNANDREMNEIVSEYETVRKSTVAFIDSCSNETLLRAGIASNSPLSVRAAAYFCSGHEIYHVNIIKERYLD